MKGYTMGLLKDNNGKEYGTGDGNKPVWDGTIVSTPDGKGGIWSGTWGTVDPLK